MAIVLALAAAAGFGQTGSRNKPNFSGVWILNRGLSDMSFQRERGAVDAGQSRDRADQPIGSGRGVVDGSTRPDISSGRGYRGDRYRAGNNGPERRNTIDELTADLRSPSPTLTVSHADPSFIVTDGKERTRVFQTNGRIDPHQIGTASVPSTTKWDGNRLVTDYDVGNGRKIRVAYSLAPGAAQLVEHVTLPNGDTMKRVYDSARAMRRR